ncbi:MAG: hypothetical protein HY814_10845, partial [Candidatus Riflebacteria bacterium]|nr:hypothetical protein [Candidatus Riflebacteria bacterium]
MQLIVKTSDDRTVTLDVEPADTVGNVKFKLQDRLGVLPEIQRLVFAGSRLEDDGTLAGYNIQNESTLQLVILLPSEAFNWTLASPATSPEARQAPSMVYDSAREKIVLFGGSAKDSENSTTFGDT